MSVRTRRTDRENSNAQGGKASVHPTEPSCNKNRIPFGEVGNKIHINPTQKGNKKISSTGLNEVDEKTIAKPIKTNRSGEIAILRDLNIPKIILPKESCSRNQLTDTSNNPLLLSEYVQDIYKYLVRLEDKFPIQPNFLEGRKITARMRTVLINWLVEVHREFNFVSETLHLSIAILDRYLQLNQTVGRDNLQLVGITSLYIASKLEEIYVIESRSYIDICFNIFSRKQFLVMERNILRQLDFNMGRPSSLQFLKRFCRVAGANRKHYALGKYLIELALIDYELCHIKPSVQGAAAYCLSVSILDDLSDPSVAWSDSLIYHSSYNYRKLESVVLKMAVELNRTECSKYKAIYTKYSCDIYGNISANTKLKGPVVQKLVTESKNINM